MRVRDKFKLLFWTRLDRYYYRELIPNYAFGLGFFTFLIMLNELFYMAKYYFEYNMPFNQVLLLLLNLIPFLLSFSIPFAILPAYLLTMGRFSQDSEIVAMKSTGIPVQRILLPGLIFAVFVAIFAFNFKDKVETQSTNNYLKLKAKLMAQKPAVELKEQSFFKIGNFKISFEDIESTKTYDILHNIHVIDVSGRKTIRADKGWVYSSPENPEHYKLKFQNGTISEVVSFDDDNGKPTEHFFICSFKFLSLNTYINLPEEFYNKSPETMTIKEIKTEINKLTQKTYNDIGLYEKDKATIKKEIIIYKKKVRKEVKGLKGEALKQKKKARKQFLENQKKRIAAIDKNIDAKNKTLPVKYLLRYHEKYAMPISALVFALVSLSLGLFSARSGRGEGLGISFGIMVMFYGMKIGINTLIYKRLLPPYGEWIPNVIFLIVAIVLFVRKVRE